MTQGLTRKKPISAALVNGEHGLARSLSGLDLTLLGIGAIIGAGIFVLTGVAAATKAGPALSLSFVMGAVACAFAALVYAEFASTVPLSGSAYTYTYVTLGELPAWIIGWDLILEYALACATVAIGWSGYFLRLLAGLGITLPAELVGGPMQGGYINLPAFGVMLLISGLLALGVRQTSLANGLIVVLKLAVIGIFLYAAVPHVEPANWQPFMPFGWEGVMAGAGLIFFAYIGFDAVSTAAEEAKNPQRDMPIGIIASLVLCTLIYIAVTVVLTGIAPYTSLNVSDPIAFALSRVGERFAAGATAIGAVAGLTSVLLVMMYGQTRVFYAMSRDGLLPKVFSTVHPRTRTPARTILATGLVIAIAAGMLPIHEVASLVNVGTLAAFIMVSVAVLYLRRAQPDLQRPFRTPFMPWVPILAILSCGYLIASLEAVTLWRFVIWMLIGVVLYFAYARQRSVLGHA
ncbi:MAG: amino acid permease [Immundisolibacter sp.]|uniref:amino acid permease n=1 Tax=Immundisolibacter sp. TaxID=1934948 RepID=UPI00199E88A7|nr:amino acid permease [Immundisolibacter sp.]MBC7162434.1 amino acid permease [Immundisolibacter sp.]